MRIFFYFLGFLLLSIRSFAQQINEKLIILTEFQEYRSNKNDKLSKTILQNLKSSLEKSGYTVQVTTKASLNEKLNEAQSENAFLLIDGFYKVSEDGSLSIYSQTYHPQKKK